MTVRCLIVKNPDKMIGIKVNNNYITQLSKQIPTSLDTITINKCFRPAKIVRRGMYFSTITNILSKKVTDFKVVRHLSQSQLPESLILKSLIKLLNLRKCKPRSRRLIRVKMEARFPNTRPYSWEIITA